MRYSGTSGNGRARFLRIVRNPRRELIRLRELEELSYREIADAVSIPIGTVTSGLARARRTRQLHSRGH